jgi:hypothetical protein
VAVIDADVDPLPADALGLAGAFARDSVTGALLDTHQFLGVDVGQLPRARS